MIKKTLRRVISLILTMIAFTWLFAAPAKALPDSGEEQYALLEEILEFLEDYALYPPAELTLAGVSADALESNPQLFLQIVDTWLADDPYGYFVLQKDYSAMYGITDGIYGIGVGVDASMPLGTYVIDILPDGAASQSGIEIGAQIVYVDGIDISDVSQGSVRSLILGEEGTEVEIGYINPGSAEVIFETIIRGPLDSLHVTGAMIDGTDVGYIQIGQFGDIGDAYEFDYYFNGYLPSEGAGSVIIDLRGNPGGELNTLLNILNVMLRDEGYLLITLVDAEESVSYYSFGFDVDLLAEWGSFIWEPDGIVILVNYNSASASEIMAGTLQSYGLASVVGEPTFGKAHSQYHIPLSSGDYLIFTFSRVELHDIGSYELVGIQPDYIVEQTLYPGADADLDLTPLDTSIDIYMQDAPAEQVIAMQERLGILGYYRAEPNGSFDEYTLWCFNRFQVAFGLTPGAYADSKSLAALVKAIDELIFYDDSQFDFAMALLGYGFEPFMWDNIFSDIFETAWYYEGVAYVNFYNVMSGTGDNLFAPGDTMTRAMFAQVLYNMETRQHKTSMGALNTEFADVRQGAWYYDAVSWAASNGIVLGSGDRFDPLRPVSRQEMAVMLYRYATEYKGREITATREMPDFDDIELIAEWAYDAARSLSEAGVINGIGGEFAPLRSATRAEVATMLMNFMQLVGK